MPNNSKQSGESHSFSIERRDFQKALSRTDYVESTQKIYLRAFTKFAERLDRKTPATATVKEAKRHLTELKQTGVSATAYATTSASLKFFFEKTLKRDWSLTGVPGNLLGSNLNIENNVLTVERLHKAQLP